ITLDGIPLSAERYAFEYRCKHGSGAGGGTFSFILSYNDAKRRQKVQQVNALLARPINLDIDLESSRGRETLSIKNVYAHSPRYARDGEAGLVIHVDVSDLRWKWVGQPFAGHFNLIRRVNDLQVIEAGEQPDVPGQVRIVDGEPIRPTVQAGTTEIAPDINGDGRIVGFRAADVLSKHATFPSIAYRQISLDWNTADFSGTVSVPRRWTALRMIEARLRGYNAKTADGFVRVPGLLAEGEWGGYQDDLVDNEYPVSRLSLYANDVQSVLNQLMGYAECRMVAWVDGKLYLHPTYSATPPDLPDLSTDEMGGVLYMTDNRSDRPSSVRVCFQKELTREFVYREGRDAGRGSVTVDSQGNDRSMQRGNGYKIGTLANVIQLPTNEKLDLGDGEKEYQRGEWHPIDAVLSAWGISGTEYVRQSIYKFFEGKVAAEIYGQSAAVAPGVDEEIQRRIAAIKQCYRKTYKIDSAFLDYLLDIKAESVVLLDPASGRRALAPIWVDYSIQRRDRIEQATIEEAILRFAEIYYSKDEENGASPSSAEIPPAPFIVTVVDPALGIIRYDPVSEIGVQEIYPWVVEDDDGREFSIGRNVVNTNLTNASPASDYTMAVHLTTSEASPNSLGQMLVIDVPTSAVGAPAGAHPPYYMRDQSETARYDVDGNLVNEGLVKARAQSIARSVLGSFQDRLAGTASWAGLHPIYPKATARYTAWAMSATGKITTELNMTEPLPKRDEDVLLKDKELLNRRLRLPEQP
ncbi:MAG: hypothetical protein ACPGVG_09250, partial [Mycobacterium sp.]